MTAREQRELARLIRRSPLLDPTSRRRWLEVLPHLKPVDGARLRQILAAGGEAGGQAATSESTPGAR